jgi:hypothetical protein
MSTIQCAGSIPFSLRQKIRLACCLVGAPSPMRGGSADPTYGDGMHDFRTARIIAIVVLPDLRPAGIAAKRLSSRHACDWTAW